MNSSTANQTTIGTLLRHFAPGISLILLASALLLFSDPRRNRQPRHQAALPKVALLNYISVPVLEDGEAGMLAGLAEAGLIDGKTMELKKFNAEGDRTTAVLISKEVVGADYDAILTLSTPFMQALASANIETGRTHVFTLSTDPWGAGIGISREDPLKHPPYMTGYGTLQPVEGVFKLAREANPDLKRVGVAWNPAESNSEASTLAARKVCKAMGIDLIEATVESSSAVLEAVKSLLNRDVQAIWAGGDTTVAAALDSMIATANQAGVPVFTNMPSDVKQGALFALGADYYEVGRVSGLLAAKILEGQSPSEVPVENFVPEQLAINTVALQKFTPTWKFGKDWKNKASIVVDESGVHEAGRKAPAAAAKTPEPGRVYDVSIVYFAPNVISELTISGLQAALKKRGFITGRNVNYHLTHAQGDLALIPSIMQKLDQSQTDLIISLTTPCLTSAATIVKQKPVVFTEVYDPIAAGAGKSASDHVPHVTGVGSFPPLEAMIDGMQAIVPGLKSIGIVYNDSEANSRKAVEVARQLLKDRELVLEEATVNNTSEILQAAQVLTLKDVGLLWEIGDNTVIQGLEGLIKAGNDAGIPVVNSDAETIFRGATIGVGISFHESGLAAGEIAADVLLGAQTQDIPFQELAVVKRAANLEAAKRLNLKLPDEFLAKCDWFQGIRARYGRAPRVAFVQLADGLSLDEAQRGVMEGLTDAGLTRDKDLDVKIYNAQGDLSQLPQIFATIQTTSADLILTSTTPAMIAAAHSTKTIPIVFTVASEPSAVGVVPPGERQSNLVGVYDNPPIAKLLDLAIRQQGSVQKVGTIWNPAEPNSEISVKRLREACQSRGIPLIERNAAATNELRDVTSAICETDIDLLVISADNITSSGFPAIANICRQRQVPIYCTEPDLVSKGATAAIGVNFYDWGRQSAQMAARILAGCDISKMPNEEVASIRTVLREQ